MIDESISESAHLGICPFGDGGCIVNRATIIEHYFSRRATKTQNHEILEWIEIIFEKE